MKKLIRSLFTLGCCLRIAYAQATTSFLADTSLAWKEGCLDIYHFNTGRGNVWFLVCKRL